MMMLVVVMVKLGGSFFLWIHNVSNPRCYHSPMYTFRSEKLPLHVFTYIYTQTHLYIWTQNVGGTKTCKHIISMESDIFFLVFVSDESRLARLQKLMLSICWYDFNASPSFNLFLSFFSLSPNIFIIEYKHFHGNNSFQFFFI